MADENLQDQINRLKKNVSDTYEVLETAGATLPDDKNSDYLDDTAKTVFGTVQAIDLGITQTIEVDLGDYQILEVAEA